MGGLVLDIALITEIRATAEFPFTITPHDGATVILVLWLDARTWVIHKDSVRMLERAFGSPSSRYTSRSFVELPRPNGTAAWDAS